MVTRQAPMSVGIVGAGYIAQAHAAAYAADPRAALSHVVDPVVDKAASLARQYSARPIADLELLLESDVDVISVCTPSPTHAEVVEAALAAGKHVLCEKPLARSVGDARRIVDASQNAPGLLMVGHVSRFEPDHRAARDAVLAGRIGRLTMMSQSIVGELPGWSERGWLEDPAQSGGPMLDLAVHSFDYLSWVSGARPERVHAVGSARADGLVDHAIATVRYDDGTLACVETSWAHPAGHRLEVATELTGDEGRLTWDYSSTAVGVVKVAGEPQRALSQLGNRGFVAEVTAFLDAVESGGDSPVPASEGLRALELALAAEESLRTGRVVRLAAPDSEGSS